MDDPGSRVEAGTGVPAVVLAGSGLSGEPAIGNGHAVALRPSPSSHSSARPASVLIKGPNTPSISSHAAAVALAVAAPHTPAAGAHVLVGQTTPAVGTASTPAPLSTPAVGSSANHANKGRWTAEEVRLQYIGLCVHLCVCVCVRVCVCVCVCMCAMGLVCLVIYSSRHTDRSQDEALRQAVALHEGKNWKEVARSLDGRTDVQCLHRWQKVLKPGLVKGPWTKEVRSIWIIHACVCLLS
jgi:hypothetical protein